MLAVCVLWWGCSKILHLVKVVCDSANIIVCQPFCLNKDLGQANIFTMVP